ncbi:hypothetical protein ACFLZ7_04110 [Nanoarchaeota archaeon]
MAKKSRLCGICGADRGFPTFAVLLLVLGLLWLFSELGVVTIPVPWFPVVLVTIALGWIIDHYTKK